MPVPSIIKVGPYYYTVVASKVAISEVRHIAHDNRTGETDFDNQRITVDPALALDTFAETLLHEVMHAIQNTVGIDPKDKVMAHEMIYRTGPTLLGVLRDNPDLVAFLMRGKEK